MAYTEFYCDYTNGNNTYAGSTTSGTPIKQLTGGDWVSATGVFTKTGAVNTIAVGDWCAVMVDGGTVAARVGRVTATDANTVTVSPTIGFGSLADQTATATLTDGGCWKGPNAAVDWPLDNITTAAVNAAGNPPRVNLLNTATYAITAAIVPNQVGPIVVQGCTSAAGDGGKATIDGSTNTISLLAPGTTADNWIYCDLIFSNNGASGANHGVAIQGGVLYNLFDRCKFTTLQGAGISISAGPTFLNECEITACNGSNTASTGAVLINSGQACDITRCYIHDNVGSNNFGIYNGSGQPLTISHTIFDTNGSSHALYWRGGTLICRNCDFYNNTAAGISEFHDGAGIVGLIENCNFVKNGTYAMDLNTGALKTGGTVRNCGFGSGTQVNTSGQLGTATATAWDVQGSVTYASNVTPWTDPANGNFTINLAAAKNAGRGAFLGTTGTTAYPDIGAVQHTDAGGLRLSSGVCGGFTN